MQNEEDAYRKIRLRVEDVQGRNCLTNFWVRFGEPLENPGSLAAQCMALFSKALSRTSSNGTRPFSSSSMVVEIPTCSASM